MYNEVNSVKSIQQPLIAVLGQTAAGKSAVAMQLAGLLNGEIISCDSMQVYKGMDIGTAKPTAMEKAAVRHHLIDILNISEPWNVSRFIPLAQEAINDVHCLNKAAILAGGSGLYARLLIYGGSMLPADKEIFRQLRDIYEQDGREKLFEELQAFDPVTAEKVRDNDRRMLRALEAVRVSRKPLPGKISWEDRPALRCRQYILLAPTEVIRQRITQRTAHMLSEGWIEETEKLISTGLLQTQTAQQALGYKQISQFLSGVITSQDELQEKIVTATVKFARRQKTWFKNQHKDAVFINVQEDFCPEACAEKIATEHRRSARIDNSKEQEQES